MIFQTGSAELPTLDFAFAAARSYFAGLEIPSRNVMGLGVMEEVTSGLEQLLANLFGIRLDPPAGLEWKTVVDAVVDSLRHA